MHRFYIPPSAWNPDDLRLEEAESHHALNVLRMQEGDKAVAFDGQGKEATVLVAPQSTKRDVRLKVLQSTKSAGSQVSDHPWPKRCRKGRTWISLSKKPPNSVPLRLCRLLSERTIARLDDEEKCRRKTSRSGNPW